MIKEVLSKNTVRAEGDLRPTHYRGLMFRRMLSVAVGLVAVVVLSVGTDAVLHQLGVLPNGPLYDTPLLVLATTYRSLYTVLGGFVAALLAPDRPMKHALALGVIGVVLGSIGAAATWGLGLGPSWYPLALIALAVPCTLLGGWFFELRSARKKRMEPS